MTTQRGGLPRGLVAAHMILVHCPLINVFVPLDAKSIPVHYAIASVAFAELILLAAWVSLSADGRWRKFGAAIGGAPYVWLWPAAVQWRHWGAETAISQYGKSLLLVGALLAFFAAAFAGARRFLGVVARLDAEPPAAGKAFSISLPASLLVTTVAAVILGLVRSSSGGLPPPALLYALFFLVFSASAIVNVWACLGPSPIGLRVGLAFCISVPLGLTLALAIGYSPAMPLRTFLEPAIIVVTPTVIVMGTLLALRRRGFRLVPPGC